MTFWSTVAACIVGIFICEILLALVKTIIDLVKAGMHEKTDRKIGFGDAGQKGKRPVKDATMRRIGFGANDIHDELDEEEDKDE